MSTQITINLPDDLLRTVQSIATLSGRPLAEVLVETIESSFQPLGDAGADLGSPDGWTDEQMMAATELQLPPDEDRRFSDLLERQGAGPLTASERSELSSLMGSYHVGLLKKATGLSEAFRRGLKAPLSP